MKYEEIYKILEKHELERFYEDNKMIPRYNYPKLINELLEAINYTSCCTQLLCIDSKTHWQVTKGRKYKMTEEGDTCYEVINDNGEKESYHKSRFKKILSE